MRWIVWWLRRRPEAMKQIRAISLRRNAGYSACRSTMSCRSGGGRLRRSSEAGPCSSAKRLAIPIWSKRRALRRRVRAALPVSFARSPDERPNRTTGRINSYASCSGQSMRRMSCCQSSVTATWGRVRRGTAVSQEEAGSTGWGPACSPCTTALSAMPVPVVSATNKARICQGGRGEVCTGSALEASTGRDDRMRLSTATPARATSCREMWKQGLAVVSQEILNSAQVSIQCELQGASAPAQAESARQLGLANADREVSPGAFQHAAQGVDGSPQASGDRVREVHGEDRKSTRLNSSHANISYAVFCLKKKTGHDRPGQLIQLPSCGSS